MRALIREYGVLFAFIVSLAATCGSLFLSEVMGYIPCNLCWFQRIFMYPLVWLLGRAAIRDDRGIRGYVLPLAIIGALFSAYHYAEQKIPGVADIAPCKTGIPCNTDYLDWFGVITIPLMALFAFILIIVFLLLSRKPSDHAEE
ncbi:disulfide oxidoreductase [Cohnella candidum]|uniref:Disulfide bond formation protein B n=1 Tax=Cohnella candidum TaxID=2674991 RepID=A0A3G3JU53_9BACL|nr:disulfide oxidoreductase [Cohnella candidum]AYQ71768.1 disulfide bond formation protein B [Cohnella candidum]